MFLEKFSSKIFLRRLALLTLKIVGSSPRRLLLGFMLIGWFLSMWISNTAAAAMTIPIAIAVIDELKKTEEDAQKGIENASFEEADKNGIEEVQETDFDQIEVKPKQSKKRSAKAENIGKAILLAIPYACSVGGTSTLTGTAPNLVLNEYWAEQYPDSPISLSYTEWMGFGIVNSICILIVMILYLNVFFIGIRCDSNKEEEKAVR